MIHYPDYPANWTPLANDAADAAWQGSPMSMFAKGGRAGCMPFEIKMPKEHVEKMAKGGLASQAKNVADAGVGGDTMVIHINRDEYNKLCKEWGEPTINPHTGLPQFTPFWKQSWFAPVAALAGTALMATGVGSSLGAGLLSTLGAGELGATGLGAATGISALGSVPVANLVGNTALSAGIGALTGGGKGALTSGLLGAAGTVGASALGNYLGNATSVGTPADVPTPTPRPDYELSGRGGEGVSGQSAPTPSGSSKGIMSALQGYATNPDKMAAAAVGLGALMGGGSSQPEMPTIAPGAGAPTDPNLTRRLDTTPVNRIRLAGPIDYYNYGYVGERRFYAPENQPVQAAHGGPLSHYVQGGGTGRSDSIPAKLSDGEYVVDAETVALLGDGSSKAGAKKLDQFRANIRKQKGKALAQGKFSPDARAPEQYLMGGRA
jgi:hypothetical protein